MNNITVLVQHKKWVESGSPYFDDTLENVSEIVEVKDLSELNNMFKKITKIDIIDNKKSIGKTYKPHDLIFISRIKRDGSGVDKVTEKQIKDILENKFSSEELYKLNVLSLSEKTFLASGFNSFVVKLKDPVN